MINKKIQDKLSKLPKQPGVYFHKNSQGQIIYVGKATNLYNRVWSYFRPNKLRDAKTKALIDEIADTDWLITDNEIDALFLEAEMIKRYMPQYNILLRDDKSHLYIRIDINSDFPTIQFVRSPLDDGSRYFGPYYSGFAIKKALRFLRRIFPYYTKTPKENQRISLYGHIGLEPVNLSSMEYKKNIRNLMMFIDGSKKQLIHRLDKEMKSQAKAMDFEAAAKLRDQINGLLELDNKILFGDKEFLDISKDQALVDIQELLNLKEIPRRIECYDISHMSGTNVVGSMVVFKNGVSSRQDYRKFKLFRDKNDDFGAMREVLSRRFSAKNIKEWGSPDLIIVDGGRGQLSSANSVLKDNNIVDVAIIGLAKKQETIIIDDSAICNDEKLNELNGKIFKTEQFTEISLSRNSHIVKLLQRLRDEAHRFAVSYHTKLKVNRQSSSILDEIPGVGPKTKTKLIKKFGSIRKIYSASENELAEIVGHKKAKILISVLRSR